MHPGGRTPSSILRKRQADEQKNQRRMSLRVKGRRVSFAPDDELETMHLFSKDKNSPLPPQDTQPLAELAQNAMAQPGQGQHPDLLWPEKQAAAPDHHHQQQQQQHLVYASLHNSNADAYLLQSPGLSPMSMELTNDTLQQQSGGLAGFGANENDSFTFNSCYQGVAAAAAAGCGLAPAQAAAGGGLRDSTLNITDNVPGLSTLVEEDEEQLGETSSSGGGGAAAAAGSELTGDASGAQQALDESFMSPPDRHRARQSVVPASPAEPSPARTTRGSSRRQSQQGTPTAAAAAGSGGATPSPAPSGLTPPGSKSRGRSGQRSRAGSRGAAAAAAEPDSTTEPLLTPLSDRPAGRGGRGLAPSMDPTPSPLRRVTRSMSGGTSPLLLSPLDGGDGDAGGGLTGGFTFTGGLTGLPGAGGDACDEESGGGGGGERRRGPRPSHVRIAEQQSKWGFIPGEEDTMNLDMNLPGAGGLGEATLHHVYSESAGTGELTLAMRHGQQQQQHAPAAAAAAGGRRRRSSVGRHALPGGRPSLAAEAIPEEAATPAAVASAAPAVAAASPEAAPTPPGAAGLGGGLTEDMAISPDLTPAAPQQRWQQQAAQQDTPAGGATAGGLDGEGLTTNLLLDDRTAGAGLAAATAAPGGGGGGWSHVPLARVSSATGRGSVGSNVPTLHSLRAGFNTTQLLADAGAAATAAGCPGTLFPPAPAAAGPDSGTAAGGLPAAFEECTTKLLADSTAASACGVMGLFPAPRATAAGHGFLGQTIAGGPLLPLGQQGGGGVFGASPPPANVFGLGAAAPAFGQAAAAAAAGGSGGEGQAERREREKSASLSPMLRGVEAAPAAAGGSPLNWQPVQKGQGAREESCLPGSQAGSEPTLELATAASHGGQTNVLEDATLDDFGVPPDLAAAAAAAGEERPITMPFSGALSLTAGAGPPGSVAHTPGGSVRRAQLIAFADFCQVVDMQFLTHVRRGTSISVRDFQPSAVPGDLGSALQLLAVTSAEVAVLEAAMAQLQAEMTDKRREAYEMEDRLSVDNPAVFATVQTAPPTQLEQTKHCLVLLKKACRAQTALSWKQLRGAMETELAERLAQQQADMDEQLAFVQAKLQKAQQQREYAASFHADVLKKLAADAAAQQEQEAGRRRLASLRSRLAELRSLNTDRQQRAQQAQQQVATLQDRCAELRSQSGDLEQRQEALRAQLAATPAPAVSRQAKARLAQAQHKLELVSSLQGWRASAVCEGEWLISFRGLAGIRLNIAPGCGSVAGRLVMLTADKAPEAYGRNSLARQLLQALVAALQGCYSFSVPKLLLPLAFSQAEVALNRALELSEQCMDLFMGEPLLTAVSVLPSSSSDGGSSSPGRQPSPEADGRGRDSWLGLVLVEPDRQLKARLLVGLPGLLAAQAVSGISSRAEVLVCPDAAQGAALQLRLEQLLQQQLAGTVTGAGGGSGGLLKRVCLAATACLLAA